jgi:predicted dehydrogenase
MVNQSKDNMKKDKPVTRELESLTEVRLGMFSFAHMHAASYIHFLAQMEGVTIAGIYDDDYDRGGRIAAQYNVPYFKRAEGLFDQELDGAVICSENALHAPLVLQAAGRVRAILCEKPIATTASDGQAMIDRCRETGTKLQIAFPMRFAPPVIELKQQLDAGVLGEIYSVKSTNHGSMPGRWFADPKLAGGGAVLDHTVHVIDLLRWFWDTEVEEVYAEVGHDLLHPGLGIDDVGLLSFRLANGVFGTLDTSWSRSPSYPTWGDVKLDVLGEQGLICVDAFEQNLQVSSEEAGKTSAVNWGSSGDEGLVADFVAMIREDRGPSVTGEDGQRALEVALAAYESARRAEPVALPI